MKIERADTNTNEQIPFGRICLGECFYRVGFKNFVYMRILSGRYGKYDLPANIVDLRTGKVDYLTDSVPVRRIGATLEIKD